MKRFSIILTVLLLTVMSILPAMAEEGIAMWVGGEEKFTFGPGSSHSETDMFPEFRNVMPGDVLEQTITVSNRTDKRVRIWLRAEGASEEDKEFLNQLRLTVDCKDKNIFDAESDQTAQLTSNTSLGVFKKNGSVTLKVVLTVPIELDSRFNNTAGTVPWVFTVEEIGDSDPQTGDQFNVWVWCAAAAVLAAAMVFVLLMLKKRRRDAE